MLKVLPIVMATFVVSSALAACFSPLIANEATSVGPREVCRGSRIFDLECGIVVILLHLIGEKMREHIIQRQKV